MSKADLEKAVSDAARVVDEWKNSIANIETQLNTANTALMRAKKTRETHALGAARGEAAAVAAIKTARDAQRDAESTIDDLKAALPPAQASLSEAQREEKKARQVLAEFEVDIRKRRVVYDLDPKIDQAIAVLRGLVLQRQEESRAIANADVWERTISGMMATSHESILGEDRLRRAIPKDLERMLQSPAHDERPKESLALADARFFNLPPDHDEKSKAA